MPIAADESLVSLLQLAMLPGIGPRTLTSLLDEFDSASEVLRATADSLSRVAGIGPKLIDAIMHAAQHVQVDALLKQCEELDIDIVPQSSEAYPKPLLDICDAPPLLFMRGDVLAEDSLAVGIVGTRHPTAYGQRQTELIAGGLARAGVTVVSGLARGIDGISHQAALDAGGRTIAVLGGGMGAIYPPEHEGLAAAVVADGALISEHPPWAKPRSGMFPQRNRLISGLSMGVCIMEAADRSGSLITARLASEQGRDCFALPGPVSSRMSQGTNKLIRDGAILIQSVDDILEGLGPLSQTVQLQNRSATQTQSALAMQHPAESMLNEEERLVLQAITTESTSIDAVIAACEIPTHRVLSTISVLEMRRLIRRLSGQYIVRTGQQ